MAASSLFLPAIWVVKALCSGLGTSSVWGPGEGVGGQGVDPKVGSQVAEEVLLAPAGEHQAGDACGGDLVAEAREDGGLMAGPGGLWVPKTQIWR